jgi:hypothetical protein
MKALTAVFAVFAILALGVFMIAQSSATAAQASDQGATAMAHARGSISRIATVIPLRPAPSYSTPRTTPIVAACKPAGSACEDNFQCCSGTCNPPPPNTPKGTEARCN